MSPYCHADRFRVLPMSNLDGAEAASPQLLRSERDCQRACCDEPACEAYTWDRNTILLGGSFAPCYFLSNGASCACTRCSVWQS